MPSSILGFVLLLLLVVENSIKGLSEQRFLLPFLLIECFVRGMFGGERGLCFLVENYILVLL